MYQSAILDGSPTSLMWYWTDRSVVYVDMHGFGYKMLKQGSRHMYFTCSTYTGCSGKTMTTKHYKNPRMLSGHTHDTGSTHLHHARCWQMFKRFTKENYTLDKNEIVRRFKARYSMYSETFNNLHIDASMERWMNDVHNVRPRSPDDYDSEEMSNGELSDSESIPPTTTTVNIFHNPSSIYTKCAVPSCNSYFDSSRKEYAGKQYFPFPEDEETRNLWIRAIGKPNDWDPKDSLVCSSHFMNSSFESTPGNVSSTRKELQEGAVPSVNLNVSITGSLIASDPLAEEVADEEDDGDIYEVTADEFIYVPVKTVNIPSKGKNDSPMSIPVVKVDKFFLQRAKEKALANLVAEKKDINAPSSQTESVTGAVDQEEVEASGLEDTEENVDDEMESRLEVSMNLLSSIIDNNKTPSAKANIRPKTTAPEKKRFLSNHEILNNAESLLKNRFRPKNSILLSRPKGVKRIDKKRGKPTEKVDRKPAERNGGKQSEKDGRKLADKQGGKKASPKKGSLKPEVKTPGSQKRKRHNGEEMVDLENQIEWMPSKWTVNKLTKAGVIPAETPKKSKLKDKQNDLEEENEEEEAGYTIVEPLNIRLNLSTGAGSEEDGNNSQDLSFPQDFEVKEEETSESEIPPFKKRSFTLASKIRESVTRMSTDSSSEIELIQECPTEKTMQAAELLKTNRIMEGDDFNTEVASPDSLSVKEEEPDDDDDVENIVEKETLVRGTRESSETKEMGKSLSTRENPSPERTESKRLRPVALDQLKESPSAGSSSTEYPTDSLGPTNALDWAFFKSILPEMHRLSPRKKACLKMTILDKLNELLYK